MSYSLEVYDPLAKSRAILDSNGNQVAEVDYDDCPPEEAHEIAETMLAALNGEMVPRSEYEQLVDHRDWEVHFRRWTHHEMHMNASSGFQMILQLPEEILATPMPTRRSLEEHVELVLSEVNRIEKDMEERMWAAYEQKLTPDQLRRKYDPLTGEYNMPGLEEESA
jgi:hypothetical protein